MRISDWSSDVCSSDLKGSALAALEGRDDNIGRNSIQALMDAVDSYIPQPDRPVDRPFLMPIEDVFSISGRGTVVTGRVETGIVKVGAEVDIVGIKATKKPTVTGGEIGRASGRESVWQYGTIWGVAV